MKILRTCKTCEFNFDGICAGHGFYNYGDNILDFESERSCWSISFDYVVELAYSLPEEDRLIFKFNDSITIERLIQRIETGKWNFGRNHKNSYHL